MIRFHRTLAQNGSVVVETHLMDGKLLTVLAASGATVTVSRVDRPDASAATGHGSDFSVASNTRVTTVVDWPYYFISVSGGACRIAVV